MDISRLVEQQRTFFFTGKTLDYSYRKDALDALYNCVVEWTDALLDALYTDLRKPRTEGFMTEIGMVKDELSFARKHLKSWMKRKRVRTPIAQFAAKSYVVKEPLGVSLVMAPWNYPVQLSLSPLIGAIASGCTCVVKPSAYAPNSSRVLRELVEGAFPREYIAVVEGGRSENKALLEQKFDFIFFTGSSAVGKTVMEKAARHLTPVLLELGGKSPCIIDKTADVKLAAKRVAFGKLINAGQTCVAPDYVLAHESVKDTFIQEYKRATERFFPNGYEDFTSIVNDKHFVRAAALIDGGKLVLGGAVDEEQRLIEPVVLKDVTWDDPVMGQEIFAPILPIMGYSSIDDAVAAINAHDRPLALYLFTSDRGVEEKVVKGCRFGGGCINDTIVHLATHHMGFGGVGESGMGTYHGKKSFDAFTHEKSIIKKSTAIDLPMRYRPYSEKTDRLIKRIMK